MHTNMMIVCCIPFMMIRTIGCYGNCLLVVLLFQYTLSEDKQFAELRHQAVICFNMYVCTVCKGGYRNLGKIIVVVNIHEKKSVVKKFSC